MYTTLSQQQDQSLAIIAAHFASPVRLGILKAILTHHNILTLNMLSATELTDERELIKQLTILEDADLLYTTAHEDHTTYHLNDSTFNLMLNDFHAFFSDLKQYETQEDV